MDASRAANPSAVEVMRGRYESAGNSARQRRLQRYVSEGYRAIDRREYATALAAFEQALRIDPDDVELHQKLEEAARLAGRTIPPRS
ncbi:MAG: hypothetical protein AAGA56_09870 [Myxococcota bacterium]